ncbi:hypothetical protein RN001_013267 [Aquatica leii]|uniref:Ketimine reductase mu-crystallin n=1 Tax=Aquatica leii TaxID=1421715 RepID=A0AAN7PRJ8_9COLE|nr:hypothetical protein RN001_013267 [Aquatica leii]
MSSLVYISEDRVRELLKWDLTFELMEKAFVGVSKNGAIQNPRTVTQLSDTNVLFTMPGCLVDDKFGALGCKIVSYFPKNQSVPTLMANILLMDDVTGALKGVIAGTEITSWRTAAASAVATKYLHKKDKKILSIIGAGTQGKIHAIAFSYFFKFEEVRIWNRTFERAAKLVEELDGVCIFKACNTVEECVKDADVVITTTGSEKPLVKLEWLKKTVHINAVGVGPNNFEVEEDVYKVSQVYIDHWAGAKTELKFLIDAGVLFKGQIGDVITGSVPPPVDGCITIFQSLGMAVEDCAMARMIYDLHTKNIK